MHIALRATASGATASGATVASAPASAAPTAVPTTAYSRPLRHVAATHACCSARRNAQRCTTRRDAASICPPPALYHPARCRIHLLPAVRSQGSCRCTPSSRTGSLRCTTSWQTCALPSAARRDWGGAASTSARARRISRAVVPRARGGHLRRGAGVPPAPPSDRARSRRRSRSHAHSCPTLASMSLSAPMRRGRRPRGSSTIACSSTASD